MTNHEQSWTYYICLDSLHTQRISPTCRKASKRSYFVETRWRLASASPILAARTLFSDRHSIMFYSTIRVVRMFSRIKHSTAVLQGLGKTKRRLVMVCWGHANSCHMPSSLGTLEGSKESHCNLLEYMMLFCLHTDINSDIIFINIYEISIYNIYI